MEFFGIIIAKLGEWRTVKICHPIYWKKILIVVLELKDDEPLIIYYFLLTRFEQKKVKLVKISSLIQST